MEKKNEFPQIPTTWVEIASSHSTLELAHSLFERKRFRIKLYWFEENKKVEKFFWCELHTLRNYMDPNKFRGQMFIFNDEQTLHTEERFFEYSTKNGLGEVRGKVPPGGERFD